MKIRDARSLPAIAQEDLRRQAVNAALSGKTHVETAKTFAVTRHTVDRWMKSHRAGGAAALKAKKKGRPQGGRLKPRQAARIAQIVIDRNPRRMKLPFYLWTREAVAELIEKRHGICLSIWTVGRYLARWGFTPQKPMRRAFERDPDKVRRWLKAEYPSIRKLAQAEKAEIHWGDEMGLRSDHAVGRSYGLRGRTPVIPGTGQRFGCHMISAITNRGKLSFMAFREKFRAHVFLLFLKRLTRQSRRKIFLIVDGHPVHRAVKVQSWIRENAHRTRLYFLPGYSPEPNPDEVLNQDVKSNAVGRQRPRNREEMAKTIRGYLYGRQKTPEIVKNYFKEKHVCSAA